MIPEDPPPSADRRRERMLASLEGLSVGDAFGQQFMGHGEDIPARRVREGVWPWTDDTEMALSVVRVLIRHGVVDQDALAQSFASEFDRARGYGGGMSFDLLPRLQRGEDWRVAAPALFDGCGSLGNGAAMRAAPLGAYFVDDPPNVVEHARRSAEITHSHPDGVAGAIAVATAAALAVRNRERPLAPAEFLAEVLSHVPPGDVRAGLIAAASLGDQAAPARAAELLGNGARVTAADTVPFCVWVASRRLDDYAEALWETVSVRGDMDTTCAIVGGIIAAGAGVTAIPGAWLRSREALPRWHLSDGHRFFR